MIPFSNCTGTITRPVDQEQYTAPSTTSVDTGVRAVISSAKGTARTINGVQTVIDANLYVDPTVDLQPGDVWTADSVAWRVVWTFTYPDTAGLGHVKAELVRSTGRSDG